MTVYFTSSTYHHHGSRSHGKAFPLGCEQQFYAPSREQPAERYYALLAPAKSQRPSCLPFQKATGHPEGLRPVPPPSDNQKLLRISI